MTKIEWTEETWNPTAGCSIQSPGCRHCYAMRMAHRLEAMGREAYRGTTQSTKRGPVWTGRINMSLSALDKPKRFTRPTLFFVNSMSDLFHPEIPDRWRDAVYQVMKECPQHTFQILTKRPFVAAAYYDTRPEIHDLPNLWLGVSVENADYVCRIDALRTIPAATRFISFEPLIGPVGEFDPAGIHWAITGGESGPRARPCHPDWVREIRDQCLAHGIAFFHKQWGQWGNNPTPRNKELDPHAKGGATLDGRLYREIPRTTAAA